MTDALIEAVRAKLLSRSQAGVMKYGVTLERKDLTTLDWLTHAQEEVLDLAGYLEVLIQQERAKMSAHPTITDLEIFTNKPEGH